ncbi:MAG: DNA methyltransferase, partial [Pseudomonadota bacterium]
MKGKLDRHLGGQMHLIRSDAEITQADLAKLAGVSIPTVRDCERSRGTIRSFMKITNALGCTVRVGVRDGPEITGTILAAHRKSLGVSQRNAAARTGLSQPTILALETRLAGRVESLVRLTQVLCISLHVQPKERPRRARTGTPHTVQLSSEAQHGAATGPPRLGQVKKRNQIASDTVNESFIACQVVHDLCEKSAPWRNMVIEGNNLDALQWLRMTMAERVKCIFIDPPYNTGNIGWVYNDRYGQDGDHDGQSTWLEFLHRRLILALGLLAEDGVILVAINDKQRARVELLLDEIIPGGRVGTFAWRTRNGSNADQTANLSQDHEHILVYAKPGFAFNGNERSLKGYSNPDDDPRGGWQPVSIRLGFSRRERPNLYYPLQDPETDIWYPCNPDSVWRFATRDRVEPSTRLQTQPVEDFIAQGRIKFPDRQVVRVFDTLEALFRAIDAGEVPASSGVPVLRRDLPDIEFWVGKKIGYGTPVRKLFPSELRKPTQPLSSWISRAAEVGSAVPDNQIVAGSNTEAARTVREIFGHRAFNYA